MKHQVYRLFLQTDSSTNLVQHNWRLPFAEQPHHSPRAFCLSPLPSLLLCGGESITAFKLLTAFQGIPFILDIFQKEKRKWLSTFHSNWTREHGTRRPGSAGQHTASCRGILLAGKDMAGTFGHVQRRFPDTLDFIISRLWGHVCVQKLFVFLSPLVWGIWTWNIDYIGGNECIVTGREWAESPAVVLKGRIIHLFRQCKPFTFVSSIILAWCIEFNCFALEISLDTVWYCLKNLSLWEKGRPTQKYERKKKIAND